MLNAQLSNGVILNANDLGQEIQLRIRRVQKNKSPKETWNVVERLSPLESFEEAANRHFQLVAIAENAQITKPIH